MALHYNLYDHEYHNEHELHIGDKGAIKQMNDYGRQCVELQADGDELEAIRQQFTGIPMSNRRVVRWDGATAAFIAMNFHDQEKV